MNALAKVIGFPIAALSFAAGAEQRDDAQERAERHGTAAAEAVQSSAVETPRDSLSAARLIGTPVHPTNGRRIGDVHDLIVSRYGNIVYVVAAVGGMLGIGAQSISVPWPDVRIDSEMRWVQTPLMERAGKISTFGFVARDDNVGIAGLTWSARDLIGDYVRLAEPLRYALVADVLFSRDGSTQSVVVRRIGSPIGPGWDYAYAGYGPARYADSPRGPNQNAPLFDRVKLEELERISDDPEKLAAVAANGAAAQARGSSD